MKLRYCWILRKRGRQENICNQNCEVCSFPVDKIHDFVFLFRLFLSHFRKHFRTPTRPKCHQAIPITISTTTKSLVVFRCEAIFYSTRPCNYYETQILLDLEKQRTSRKYAIQTVNFPIDYYHDFVLLFRLFLNNFRKHFCTPTQLKCHQAIPITINT